MSDSPVAAAHTFAEVSRHVLRRLWLRHALQRVVRTLPYAAAALVLLIVLRVTGATGCGIGLALVLASAWIAGCFAFAWWRRPGAYASLAFWDQQAGRRDAFANAWWFEKQQARDTAQDFHLRTQREILPEALHSLRRDIDLPNLRWLASVPLLLIALVLIPSGSGLHLPDAMLTKEGRRLAEHEGQKLAEKKLDVEKMKALSEDEKKELEKLQQKIAETAKSLGQEKAETAREVLSELEKHARDAEKLAEKLGAGSDAWASDQMVAEMREHADTAELGDAVANKSTENTAKEAERLAGRLRDEKLASETRERLTETLHGIGKLAQPEDKERTVGQHVIAADQNLAQALPKDAGVEFQKLADKMKTLAARDKAREKLEKLAQQLRESGSSIAGEGAQGMQQLAGNQGQNQEGQQSQSGQGQMQKMANAPQMQPMQAPGMSNATQGQNGGQSMQTLQPADGDSKNDKGLALAPPGTKPGDKSDGKNDKPMLFAPVPGLPPDQQPNAAILMPGSSASSALPGTGSAKMGNDPTKAAKAEQQGVVNAQRNAEGESSVRSIEGGVHDEQAKRSAQATALDAIKAEENALDDAALPVARREQVRRYFTELRKRFEKEN
ncbi:MAG: hypothetical protein K8R87_03820 [Verrucomicrobia bacterium]|nr:hypothetical protein [Verrucomicrobiota bacterium]